METQISAEVRICPHCGGPIGPERCSRAKYCSLKCTAAAGRERRGDGDRIMHREWCRRNREKCVAWTRKRYWQNPEASIDAAKQWVKDNKERRRKYARKHYDDNRGYYLHNAKRRKKAVRAATPNWLTKEQITEMGQIYQTAQQLGLVVDHIVPLQGKHVCGLHVPWNLRPIPADVNRQKSNSHV